MKQPEYSPLEALERIKLMMKYDMSKTLNENKEVIKEPINEWAPLVIPAITIAAPWLYATAAGFTTFKEEETHLVKLKHFYKDVLHLIKT
jgi:hypothetical protein